MATQGILYLRLTPTSQRIQTCARVKAHPDSCRGSVFNLHPSACIAGNDSLPNPAQQISQDWHLPQRLEGRYVPHYCARQKVARKGHYFSTTKLPMTSASIPEL